jgi:hypothetical protein
MVYNAHYTYLLKNTNKQCIEKILFESIFMSIFSKNYNLHYFVVSNADTGKEVRYLKVLTKT